MNNKSEEQENGSGGNGGEIYIFAKEIKGNGKILADGGNGFVGGQGGKVHLFSEDNSYTGVISAKGGKSHNKEGYSTRKIDWQKWGAIAAFISVFVTLIVAFSDLI